MQYMVVMDKLPMTCSYAELNFKLQHISSFFTHHPPTIHQQPTGWNVIIIYMYILLIHVAFSMDSLHLIKISIIWKFTRNFQSFAKPDLHFCNTCRPEDDLYGRNMSPIFIWLCHLLYFNKTVQFWGRKLITIISLWRSMKGCESTHNTNFWSTWNTYTYGLFVHQQHFHSWTAFFCHSSYVHFNSWYHIHCY